MTALSEGIKIKYKYSSLGRSGSIILTGRQTVCSKTMVFDSNQALLGNENLDIQVNGYKVFDTAVVLGIKKWAALGEDMI